MKTYNHLLVTALEKEAAHVRRSIQKEYNTWIGYHEYNIRECSESLAPLQKRYDSIAKKIDKAHVKMSSRSRKSFLLNRQYKALTKSLEKVGPLIESKKKNITASQSFNPERDLNSSRHNSLTLKLARLEEALFLARKGKLNSAHARSIQDLIDSSSYAVG